MRSHRWVRWLATLGATVALLVQAREALDKSHIALALLIVVLIGSAAEGRSVGISLAGLAFLAFNWFFLRPFNTLAIADPLDWFVLLAFLVTGVVAAELLERQRGATLRAEQRGAEINRLALLGAETLKAPRAEEALSAIAAVLCEALSIERCEIFSWEAEATFRRVGHFPPTGVEATSELLAHTHEHGGAVAKRADGTVTILSDALIPDRSAAHTPTALLELQALAIPLAVRGQIVGALRLSGSSAFSVSDDQRGVLRALSYYAALGLERLRLSSAEHEAEQLRRADALKDALLAAVSHDLRTPLTAIKGIANEIWRGGDPLRAQVVEEETDRLAVLVNELLELSQINAGVLGVVPALNAVDDVVGVALERVESAHASRRISVHIANDGAILVGMFDFAHTVRALTNLMENAVKYGPPDSVIDLTVRKRDGLLYLTVEDRGPGVLAGDEARIFEPFYRSATIPDSVRGTGLGLSIARRLVEAQGGTLTYAPRAGGGSRFEIALPAATIPGE